MNDAGSVEETTQTNQPENGGAMPSARFQEFDRWKPPDQLSLVDIPPISAPLTYINPDNITVTPIYAGTMIKYQRALSRAAWKPRGRNLPFTVNHQQTIIALICLSSPVITRLAPRDDYLNLPRNDVERGVALRNYAELSVCVGVQPLAWYWNIGKLAALISLTLGDCWQQTYGDEMIGVLTTSLWGKGSQYNRIYKHLGYTQGYGTSHIPDYVFDAIRAKLKAIDKLPNFGPRRTRTRPKLLNAYKREFGIDIGHYHGEQRAIYYHDAIPPEQRQQVIEHWHTRWGLPRYQSKQNQQPPY